MTRDAERVATGDVELRLMASDELSDAVRAALRALLWQSFPGDFTEDDWQPDSVASTSWRSTMIGWSVTRPRCA
ncbi:MAG: hypothetical protein LH630_03040 [Actinomycetia bacterium]|nr:hypothetical protein [Actinomycetes bacterium]